MPFTFVRKVDLSPAIPNDTRSFIGGFAISHNPAKNSFYVLYSKHIDLVQGVSLRADDIVLYEYNLNGTLIRSQNIGDLSIFSDIPRPPHGGLELFNTLKDISFLDDNTLGIFLAGDDAPVNKIHLFDISDLRTVTQTITVPAPANSFFRAFDFVSANSFVVDYISNTDMHVRERRENLTLFTADVSPSGEWSNITVLRTAIHSLALSGSGSRSPHVIYAPDLKAYFHYDFTFGIETGRTQRGATGTADIIRLDEAFSRVEINTYSSGSAYAISGHVPEHINGLDLREFMKALSAFISFGYRKDVGFVVLGRDFITFHSYSASLSPQPPVDPTNRPDPTITAPDPTKYFYGDRQLFLSYRFSYRLDLVRDVGSDDDFTPKFVNFPALVTKHNRPVDLTSEVSISDQLDVFEVVPYFTLHGVEENDEIFLHTGAANATPTETPDFTLYVHKVVEHGKIYRQRLLCSTRRIN